MTPDEQLAVLEQIKTTHPNNLAAKHFSRTYYDSLGPADQAALLMCVRSGSANANSGVGCYAARPEDYDNLIGFFGPLIAEYHKVSPDTVQVTDWTNPPPVDLADFGLGQSSCRVRVGRNLADFPLPAVRTQPQVL